MIILRQKEFASINQILKSNNRVNQMWTSAYNRQNPNRMISSWSRLENRNIKRAIKKSPRINNNILSEGASRNYENIGKRNPNTAKKLTDMQFRLI